MPRQSRPCAKSCLPRMASPTMLAVMSTLLMTVDCATAARSPEPDNSPHAVFVADSIQEAKCKSTVNSSRSTGRSSAGDAFIRVHASYREGDTVSGATFTSEKPHLVVRSWPDGLIRIALPSDSIPKSHSVPVIIRLIGFRPAKGTVEVFPGDTVNVEVRLCPQSFYTQEQTRNQ